MDDLWSISEFFSQMGLILEMEFFLELILTVGLIFKDYKNKTITSRAISWIGIGELGYCGADFERYLGTTTSCKNKCF